MAPENMKQVYIADELLKKTSQLQFPIELTTQQAKINYLVRIGLDQIESNNTHGVLESTQNDAGASEQGPPSRNGGQNDPEQGQDQSEASEAVA